MVKILVLGGTRFLGRDFVALLDERYYDAHIASRSDPGRKPFYQFDRKNSDDVARVVTNQRYDVIVDFISFSLPDAQKVISAIDQKPGYRPYLVTISSTYVYDNPAELEEDKVYDESSFDPTTYRYSLKDRPEIDYYAGKRSMEAYVANNYDNYALVRLPVILGPNDYTGKTTFFLDVIRHAKTISFDEQFGVSNYIFSKEAAQFLNYMIRNRVKGIINSCFPERLDQRDVLCLYCEFLKKPLDSVLQPGSDIVRSPFYYRKDFVINNENQAKLMKFEGSFEQALARDMKIITN